jgi:hypothetical protein
MLSVITAVPVRVPAAEGLKVTCRVQVPAGARDAGKAVQSELATTKSPPVAKLVTVRLLVPVFVRVTVCAPLVVPTV